MKKIIIPAIVYILFCLNIQPAFCTSILTFGDDANSGFHTLVGKDKMNGDNIDVSLYFDVSEDVLTLRVENWSHYSIKKIFFNVPQNVKDLTLVSSGKDNNGGPPYCPGKSPKDKLKFGHKKAGKFGHFDARLKIKGHDGKGIGPHEVYTTVMNISGTGSFSDTDFTTLLSCGAKMSPALAALKLKKGCHGMDGPKKGFAAVVVPEPSSLLLLSSGVLGILGLRRRNRRK